MSVRLVRADPPPVVPGPVDEIVVDDGCDKLLFERKRFGSSKDGPFRGCLEARVDYSSASYINLSPADIEALRDALTSWLVQEGVA